MGPDRRGPSGSVAGFDEAGGVLSEGFDAIGATDYRSGTGSHHRAGAAARLGDRNGQAEELPAGRSGGGDFEDPRHHPGWVHIFAVKESATVYDTRHARADGYAQIIARRGACIHYYQVNSHLGRRYAGLRLKHSFGPASVKLYNRPGGILRMEMTTYDVSFFRHYRQVVHRDGTKEQMLATRKKSIDSLRDLAELMQAGVHRYSQWLASLAEHTAGHRDIIRLGRPEQDAQGRSYRGFNPFLEEDERGLQLVLSGEHAVGGLTARRLRRVLHSWSRGRISRLLKQLRWHGLLRKAGKTCTYHFTSLARRVIPAVLHLKNNLMAPELAAASAA